MYTVDRGTSHLSVFSTAASENQTLQLGSPRADEPRRASVSSTVNYADNSMDVDEPERSHNISVDSIPSRVHSLPLITPTPERVVIPPPTVIHTPDGKVIIEELDTPAIRKEKSAIRKEQRLRAREELMAAETAAAAVASTSQIAMEDGEPLSPMSPSPGPPSLVEAGPLALITPGAEADPADADADADADAEADTDDAELSELSEVEAEAPKLDGGMSGFAEGARDESGDGEWAEPANAKQVGRVEDKRVGRAQGKKSERANGKRPQSAPSRPRAPKADRERHRDLGKIVLPVGQKRIEPGTLGELVVFRKAVISYATLFRSLGQSR
jgi:hypothetical protein